MIVVYYESIKRDLKTRPLSGGKRKRGKEKKK